MSLPTELGRWWKRRTLLDLLCEEFPPRFVPSGTPFPFSEKGRCRWCGGLVGGRRRTWCSDACVKEWTVRSSASFVRSYVWKRDQGVCAECGADCSTEATTSYGDVYTVGIDGPWDADHIVPVWKGGGLCGLDGYQTLCRPCHALKTAADAAERADRRRPEPEPTNQMQLAAV